MTDEYIFSPDGKTIAFLGFIEGWNSYIMSLKSGKYYDFSELTNKEDPTLKKINKLR